MLAALAGTLAFMSDLAHMGSTLVEADWRWIGVALGLTLLSLLARSVALKAIVDAGQAGTTVADAFSATVIGQLANAVIPVRVGTVLTPYVLFLLLRRRHVHLPFATLLGMHVSERLFAVATFVVLSLFLVATQPVPLWAMQLLAGLGAVTGLLLAGGVLLERRRRRAEDGLVDSDKDETEAPPPSSPSSRLADRLRHVLPRLADSQRIMGRPWHAALAAAGQSGAWLLQLGAALAAVQAFHLGAAGLRGAALVLVLTALIGFVPLTPGNVGTFQVAAVAALAVHGVPTGQAMAYALGLQTLQLAVPVAAGLIALSAQGMSLGDLRARSRQSAELLRPLEQHATSAAE